MPNMDPLRHKIVQRVASDMKGRMNNTYFRSLQYSSQNVFESLDHFPWKC